MIKCSHGDYMRTFYLFKIKKNILKNYKYNYEELFSLLEDIHLRSNEDIILCYEIFKSIVNPIDKDKYSEYIKEKNICHENYICYNNIHNINDYYDNENTKMLINNSYIKIDSNKNIPSFFFDMKSFKNLFVCDFEHHDYFLLEEII